MKHEIGPVVIAGGPDLRIYTAGSQAVYMDADHVTICWTTDVEGTERHPRTQEWESGRANKCHLSAFGKEGVCCGWVRFQHNWGFHVWREIGDHIIDTAKPFPKRYIGSWSEWPQRKHRRR